MARPRRWITISTRHPLRIPACPHRRRRTIMTHRRSRLNQLSQSRLPPIAAAIVATAAAAIAVVMFRSRIVTPPTSDLRHPWRVVMRLPDLISGTRTWIRMRRSQRGSKSRTRGQTTKAPPWNLAPLPQAL